MTVSLPIDGRRFRIVDFQATVIAVIEAGVALLPVDVDPTLLPPEADNVFLTFPHGRQLVGLKGTLTWQQGGRGLRFQVQDGVNVRRNRFSRVAAELRVTVAGADGVTIDIAPEGLLVRADLAVALGQQLDVSLTLPERVVTLRAETVRHAGGMIALRFLPEHREDCAAVAEFVVERRAAQLLAAQPKAV